MALAAIGARQDGGVDRQALTAADGEAWARVIAWGVEDGLEPSCDAAGNLFLARRGRDPSLQPLLLGSHLDTQPTGGRFDGAFGVLAALEAAATIHEPARDVVCVAWMNEEGSRFAPGMMGSEAFAGVRSLAAIRGARDADGVTAGEALDTLLAHFAALPRRKLGFPLHAYLEAHIEQGTELERAGIPIGIVTGIQGKVTFEAVIEGEEGHAGTLPMTLRRDALLSFSRAAKRLYEEVGGTDGQVKFTIGRIEVWPNAPSVVPGRVSFRMDLRHPDGPALAALALRVEAILAGTATVRRLVDAPPNDFDPALRARITDAASRLGHAALPVLSAAGHDARHMAPLCPSAMIFIPCRGGISHAPEEWSDPEHVAAGAAVLLAVTAELSEGNTNDG
jgi:N-carbamoyl-L-amino-acid hydrolase